MNVNRREFIGLSSGAALAWTLGARGAVLGKRTLAMIGCGIQSRGLLHQFLGQNIVVVGVCDVDKVRREHVANIVKSYYDAHKELNIPAACKEWSDFREVLSDPSIDAVCVATPDHWHAFITVEAFKAGKDVYCEKPLAWSVNETVAVMKAAQKYKRILQTGAMQRSGIEFRTAATICRNGFIGKIKYVDCNFGGPSRPRRDFENPNNAEKEGAPNPNVNFDMWCGPAPLVKYSDRLAQREAQYNNFPNFWRMDDWFGSGMVGDWGAHHMDIAQWGLGLDNSGPVKVIASKEPPSKNPFDGGRRQRGMQFICADGTIINHCGFACFGTVFYGTEGIVAVNRGRFAMWRGKGLAPDEKLRKALADGTFDGMEKIGFWVGGSEKNPGPAANDRSNLDAINKAIKACDLKKVPLQLYVSRNHPADFVARCEDRKSACSNEQVGGRASILCQLCNMSYLHDASFDWNPKKLTFANGTGDKKWLARTDCRETRKEFKVSI